MLKRPCSRTIVFGFVLLLLMASSAASHAQQASTEQTEKAHEVALPYSFEVATVKPTPAVTDGHTHINYPAGGGFSASNVTLAALMQWAYEMPERNIVNGPEWVSSTRFDVMAKSDAVTDEALRKLPSDEAGAAKRRMVQGFFAERFGLQLHHEVRTLPAFDLVVAKGGSKLQASASNGKSIGTGRNHFNAQGLTSSAIAEQLSAITSQIVVDKTNLPGRYDLKLQWAPDDGTGDPALPSFSVALEEQLGLKLEKTKEPVPVLVIDTVQQPSAN